MLHEMQEGGKPSAHISVSKHLAFAIAKQADKFHSCSFFLLNAHQIFLWFLATFFFNLQCIFSKDVDFLRFLLIKVLYFEENFFILIAKPNLHVQYDFGGQCFWDSRSSALRSLG